MPNKGVDPSACGKSLNKRAESNQRQNLQKLLEPQNVNNYKIKFFCLNVGGLKSKLISEDLKEQILEYDIVCSLEI